MITTGYRNLIPMVANYLLQFGSNGSSAGQLSYPAGIAVHKDKAYIADYIVTSVYQYSILMVSFTIHLDLMC